MAIWPGGVTAAAIVSEMASPSPAGSRATRTWSETVRAKASISAESGASYFRCWRVCSPTMLTIGVLALRAL